MLLFLKKKPEDPADIVGVTETPRELHEFVPYYCHYSPHTLLTKNGELMQTLKISNNNRGLNYESGDGSQNTLRNNIRRAIQSTVTDDKFSFWIHTLRKRKPISFDGNFTEPFAAYVHDQWQKKHRWRYQYYNEIYLTILHDAQDTPLIEKNRLKDAVLPKWNRRYRNEYLDNASAELDRVVSSVVDKIGRNYNAHQLGIVERMSTQVPGQVLFYSEPLEFLGTLINLREENHLVPEADLSAALCTHSLTFGYNAMESKNRAGGRRFGALLTLKQYREMPEGTVDRLLQSPIELIISQAFHYIPNKEALRQYKEQKELFDISGDTYSVKASGLEEMLKSNHNKPTDFGKHQTSFTVLVDEYKHLDAEVSKAQEAFAELGLITVREDIKLEECFWSQLPGNFEFLRRADAISTSKIAGFCRLNLFPSGINTGNHWGEALALVPTTVNSPYFFNFHHRDNGHTVLFNFNSFRDQVGDVMLNFLVTSALKYQGNVFVFDRNRSSYLLFDKLGGQYHTFPLKSDQNNVSIKKKLGLNPFALEDTPRNRGFLLAWCNALVDPNFTAEDQHKAVLQQAIADVFTLAPEQRNITAFAERLTAAHPQLGAVFSAFYGRGKMAGLFDAASENLDFSQHLHAFDMDPAGKTPGNILSLFSYLLHRIITQIDGKPTLIVLHEAWDLLDNPFFAPRLESLLEMLKQNNVCVVFTAGSPPDCVNKQTFSTVINNCGTHLYIPDDVTLNYESKALQLNAHDSQMLAKMERQKGDFLIKQGEDSIGLRINLDSMDDIRAIFANDIKNLIAAGGTFASLPQDY